MNDDIIGLVAVLCSVGLPILLIFGRPYYNRILDLKEKRIEAETRLAAEKAAQYAASNKELETRVRVLEQIITDGGLETAAQIEALRKPRLTGEKRQ
jgi:hypothetical protein